VLSTPEDYSRGIITGIKELFKENELSGSAIEEVIHGSTIVTNACIELKGAKVGLITTKGFRDVLEIARGRMPVLYDLSWSKPAPLAQLDPIQFVLFLKTCPTFLSPSFLVIKGVV